MIESFDLSQPVSFPVDGGRVEVDPSGTVSVIDNQGVRTSIVVPSLQDDEWLEVWRDQGWCCLVGLKGSSVVVASPFEGRIEVVGELDRLDMGDRYDPGGLEFVAFHPLSDGDLLVVYEHGVARVSRDRLVWQRAHFDLSARLAEVASDIVWFSAEVDDRFGFRLNDGADVFTGSTR